MRTDIFVPLCSWRPDITRSDGRLAVAIIDNSWSRSATAAAGLYMRNGRYLVQQKGVLAVHCKEFRLVPKTPPAATGGKPPPPLAPFNIDGDPQPAGAVHVRCLHQAINVFHIP